MTKRMATSVLNRDNWDQEEELEEPTLGVPAAPEPELKRRLIIAGRRRLTPGVVTDKANGKAITGIFAGFAGFKSTTTSSLQNPTLTNGHGTNAFKPFDIETKQTSLTAMNGTHDVDDSNEKVIFVDVDKDLKTTETGKESTSSRSMTTADKQQHKQFCKHLKALNEGLLKWVEQHLKSNAYLDLSPVFTDYVDHFKKLEHKYNVTKKDAITSKQVLAEDQKAGTSSAEVGQSKSTQNSNSELFAPKFATQTNAEAPHAINFGFVTEKQPMKLDDSAPKFTPTFNFGQSTTFDGTLAPPPVLDFPPRLDNASMNFCFGQSTSITGTKAELAFGFGSQSVSSDVSNGKLASGFVFGGQQKDKSSNVGEKPTIQFGKNSDTSATTTKFSFGLNESTMPKLGYENKVHPDKPEMLKPGFFSFLTATKQPATNGSESASSEEQTADDDGEYQHHVTENVAVEEKDAFHSIKCKLFYKSGEQYVERGVGALHLKKLDAGKTQLLIRADTSLGNILLNVCLAESMPTSRVGKNNVSLVCVPNPPIKPPKGQDGAKSTEIVGPTAMLIRVKTETDADDLLSKIDAAKFYK